MDQPQSHRDPEVEELNHLTERIIGCAIAGHRVLGPGLLKQTYGSALCIELVDAGLQCVRQKLIPIACKGKRLGDYRLDLLVEDRIIVEVKCVERFDPVFQAQLLTYLCPLKRESVSS
jgi:GxxExxY protein